MRPLSADQIRAYAIILAKKGTIQSYIWERMTGAERYAVFMTAGLIMQIGVPGVGMGASVAGIDTLALVEGFVPPPGAADPAPEPRPLDPGEAEKMAAWIFECAEMGMPPDISTEAQHLILSMVNKLLLDKLAPGDDHTLI